MITQNLTLAHNIIMKTFNLTRAPFLRCAYLENVCIEGMFQKAGGSDDEAPLWFEGEPGRR